ncbi:MAG: hypothetical protein RLZZ306_3651 [Bacteroidota bacterium]|jgi:hypothetical protein
METTTKKTINNSQKTMPYINMDSPELKKELQKMDEIIKKIKFPLVSK